MTSSARQKDRAFQNRFTQNNLRSTNSQETRNTFKPNAGQPDNNRISQNQDNDVKNTPAISPGLDFIKKERTFLQEIAETIPVRIKKEIITEDSEPVPARGAANSGPTIEEQLLQPGLLLKVLVIHVEDRGLFWVQTVERAAKVADLCEKLKEFFSTSCSPFNPVQDGICGVNYEGKWYRCQIRNLNPLSVLYIDFGYPEEVEANRLFKLSSEFLSFPPMAFKIKLIDGTPASFLGKGEADILDLKLVEKVDSNYWLTQVVKDGSQLEAVLEAATTNNPPAVEKTSVVPTPKVATPAVATPVTPAEPAQNDVTADTLNSSVPQQPYPAMLDASKFTTVIATYPGSTEQSDTYYVGASNVWEILAEMCSHFKKSIQHCEVIPPKHGAKGLAIFMDEWYRVKVVSLTPKILAHFIDFGNIEPVEPEGLKRCPESHKDVPPLVHKIKLAPGTNKKYSNLPEGSEISVKPVSWLADGTVVVEVEGENYAVGTVPGPDDSTPGATVSPSTPGALLRPPAPTSDAHPPTNPTSSCPSRQLVDSQATKDTSGTSSVKTALIPNRSLGAVDMLQEKWKISFVPSRVDYVKNSLLGQVYSEHIPATFTFMVENEKYQNYLSSQKFDPDFKPNVGDIVGLCLATGDWERGTVLPQQGLVAFSDNGGVTRSSQLFKLPDLYVDIPPMAAVLTLSKEDPDLLSRLVDEDEIIFDVLKVASNNSRTVITVTNIASLEGELKPWDYEPLETPEPLAPGEPVTISRVIDANTLLVSPANDLEIQESIQVDCRKTREELKCLPKEGDYVSFLDKESDGHFRCRVDKVDGDTIFIYAVDNATYHQANLGDLYLLPSSLRNVPCRISQIELKDVEKVDLTEEAHLYLSHIVEEDKALTFVADDSGKATLTVEGEEDTLNSKLKVLLKPEVKPNLEGKLTILSLPELQVPLNQTFEFIVSQSDPLYVQLAPKFVKYFAGLHITLQDHCAKDKAPYNPCEGELCLALFEGEWFRARCLKETNTGVSVVMFVDYGNILHVQTSDIRRILPEMLTVPSMAVSCRIHGLPDPISPALKTRLTEVLQTDAKLTGEFVAENDGCYEAVFESVNKSIQDLL